MSSTEKIKWMPVAGFEGRYEVSSEGQIRRCAIVLTQKDGRLKRLPKRLLKPTSDGAGYLKVILSVEGCATTRRVHSLVASAFLGPRAEGQEVRHLNGKKKDNRVSNLAYGSSFENARDCQRHGRFRINEGHQNCVLSVAEIDEIRKLPRGSIKPWALARGVSLGHVYNIRSGCRRTKT